MLDELAENDRKLTLRGVWLYEDENDCKISLPTVKLNSPLLLTLCLTLKDGLNILMDQHQQLPLLHWTLLNQLLFSVLFSGLKFPLFFHYRVFLILAILNGYFLVSFSRHISFYIR